MQVVCNFSGPVYIVILFFINKIEVEVDFTVWDFKMWLFTTTLTRVYYTKMYGRFTWLKQSGHNYNQVTACTTEVAVSRGSTVLQNVTRYQRSCDNNNDGISMFILLHEKLPQSDWLRAVVFSLV